jgi:hypothetical protein
MKDVIPLLPIYGLSFISMYASILYVNYWKKKTDPNVKNEFLSFNNGSIWSNRFILSTILQGSIIILITTLGIAMQIIYSSTIDIIQFLSLSFEGPAKWIFLGYIFYLIMIVAIATVTSFYNHLEVILQRRIVGLKSVLAWIHLIGLNVGIPAVTITIIYAGLVGSGILDLIVNGQTTSLRENITVMTDFIVPIAIFAGILIIGTISGTLLYFLTCFQNSKYKGGSINC